MLGCVQLFVNLWTEIHQGPLSMEFYKQEYWSRLLFPPPGDLPNPGIKPTSPTSPALQADSLPTELQGKLRQLFQVCFLIKTEMTSSGRNTEFVYPKF